MVSSIAFASHIVVEKHLSYLIEFFSCTLRIDIAMIKWCISFPVSKLFEHMNVISTTRYDVGKGKKR